MRKQTWKLFLLAAFTAAFVLTGFLFFREKAILAREKADFERLAQQVEQSRQEAVPAPLPPSTEGEGTGAAPALLPQYAQLAAQNPDMIGWIRVSGTAIDYPVMYTPEDPEYYLRRDFNGQPSRGGTPFIGAECSWDPPSDNLLLFGHNLYAGHDMFTDLLRYREASFFEENPLIFLDTLYEEQRFRVLAAFYSKVYYAEEDVFKFYRFIDAESDEDYNDYLRGVRSLALYETGTQAQPGDQLLTIVTCSLHENDGRFVVVAVKEG
ncbi:MAG: class B sortase [Oscillospiraceae bacterium]|nr:class B sortase [Oscillospiraceae bacterium]